MELSGSQHAALSIQQLLLIDAFHLPGLQSGGPGHVWRDESIPLHLHHDQLCDSGQKCIVSVAVPVRHRVEGTPALDRLFRPCWSRDQCTERIALYIIKPGLAGP